MIKSNKTKGKIQSGSPAIGTFVKLTDPSSVEVLGLVGFDFVIIDSEHVGFNKETITQLIRTAELNDLTPIVRVRKNEEVEILQMLDIGAQGVQVPNVNTENDAKKVIQSVKYSPLGNRGFAGTNRAAAFGLMDGKEYAQISNKETMVICHCETKTCIDNLDAILKEEIDVIFIGPMDLSQSLGVLAESNHPKVMEAIELIVKKVKSAGKEVGIIAANAEEATRYIDEGFRYITISSDQGMIVNFSKENLKKLNQFKNIK